MEKQNIDWGSLGFGYIKTDKRYVSIRKSGILNGKTSGVICEKEILKMRISFFVCEIFLNVLSI